MEETCWFQIHAKNFSRELNGYLSPPSTIYSQILPLIIKPGKIMDIGCGNGMLLKYLVDFSEKKLTPYGIDENETAISQLRKEIFPLLRDNFMIIDAKNYMFENAPFDTIISSLFIEDSYLNKFIDICISKLSEDGRLIYMIYDDVIKRLKNSDHLFINHPCATLNIIKKPGIMIAIYDMNKKNQ